MEALASTGGRTVFGVDPTNQTVTSSVVHAGLSGEGALNHIYGGILMDPRRKRAIVAGLDDVGILDTSSAQPKWDQTSIVSTVLTDSISFNPTTGMLFVSGSSGNQIIDTTESPLIPLPLDSSFGLSEGNAFGPKTNMLLLTQNSMVVKFWGSTLIASSSPPILKPPILLQSRDLARVES